MRLRTRTLASLPLLPCSYLSGCTELQSASNCIVDCIRAGLLATAAPDVPCTADVMLATAVSTITAERWADVVRQVLVSHGGLLPPDCTAETYSTQLLNRLTLPSEIEALALAQQLNFALTIFNVEGVQVNYYDPGTASIEVCVQQLGNEDGRHMYRALRVANWTWTGQRRHLFVRACRTINLACMSEPPSDTRACQRHAVLQTLAPTTEFRVDDIMQEWASQQHAPAVRLRHAMDMLHNTKHATHQADAGIRRKVFSTSGCC
ncbi:hypothetical protein Vretimale_398 [Volvox reticuliferus]|uniref:Uncharacterized protein n=1 Tax=Volvox reticuliferus TaxID=1737510 RepID=A0A8J4D6Y0_9CHLO|nr:hypothetical protein Vretimale_398 [Volvox reticuliferus]